ncbi:hypothetical protein Tco_0883638, partial [Tanacetum coccineum]
MKREGKDFSGRVTPLRKQKKTTAVPHPSDSIANVPNEESVPTHSNDLLLSGEDRLKLTDLMDICTKLFERGRSRIEAINRDAKVTLVDETQEINDDNLMFDTDVVEEQEKDVAEKEVSTADLVTTAGEVVTTANVEVTTVKAPTTNIDELTLAQNLIEIKAQSCYIC